MHPINSGRSFNDFVDAYTIIQNWNPPELFSVEIFPNILISDGNCVHHCLHTENVEPLS